MALAVAKMMRDDDVKVYGIDHIPKLIEQARENVNKYGIWNFSELINKESCRLSIRQT